MGVMRTKYVRYLRVLLIVGCREGAIMRNLRGLAAMEYHEGGQPLYITYAGGPLCHPPATVQVGGPWSEDFRARSHIKLCSGRPQFGLGSISPYPTRYLLLVVGGR